MMMVAGDCFQERKRRTRKGDQDEEMLAKLIIRVN